MADATETETKRHTAQYSVTSNLLHRTRPDLSAEEIDQLSIESVDKAVFGHDAKKDRKGNYMEQGIGSPGNETHNHFAAIKKYEGKEAYEAAVRELWKRDPERAEKLGLPKPPKPGA
jgi:hypothetical protein